MNWIEVAEIKEGPIFRRVTKHDTVLSHRLGDRPVALVVKDAAARAGLDASKISGHSLRAGFVTQLMSKEVAPHVVMDQTGHLSESTLRRYDRAAKRFRNNTTKALGL
jgi:site-specific recombinase XerD